MTLDDLPPGRHLVSQAGWNQLDSDWLRAMELEPKGCFIAEINGAAVATTTTVCLGNVAWIAMVLVDEKMRGQGIARQLLEHGITYLESRNISTIRLDATVFGKGLYHKLGFEEEYEVIRFAGNAANAQRINVNIRPLKNPALIAGIDLEISGTDREKLLQKLIGAQSPPFYCAMDDDKVIGYAGCRIGMNAVQIGPAVAMDNSAGASLLDTIVSHFPGQKAFIDIPVQNQDALFWAKKNGFTEQRRFVRMYRGVPVRDFPEKVWASSGPEKG